MIECNYSKDILDSNVASGKVNQDLRNRIVKSHMELQTVKDMLRANDLSKTEAIYLMHLSDTNADEERFKREIQALTGKIVYVC
jgi:phosphoribosyl 1,2-cyclic phosphodiesterase